MNTCDTCKHWTPPFLDVPHAAYGFNPEHRGECDSDKFTESGDTLRDGLMYWDGEGYAAGFNTGPRFGCIHHKEISK